MKPVASLLFLAVLCACSHPSAGPADEAAAQASRPADAAPAAPAQGPAMTSSNQADPLSGAAPATGDVPPDARGIAVGEPHPSSDARIDAGPARYDGYGALRFGMSAAEARKAWDGTLQGDEVKTDNCAYLHAAGTAAGPYLMFEQGRFVRYDVRGANTTAPGGGRVGLAGDDIRRLYAGRVEESPHEYVPGGKYLRVADPASKDRALLFEVDEHGRVTTWRAGRVPQVGYVEGCS